MPSPARPSPAYRLLVEHLPLLTLGKALPQLVADLPQWQFDPNETHLGSVGLQRGHPVSLIQGFALRLPPALAAASPEGQAALAMFQALVDAGADAAALDAHGRPLEDLGPAELGPAIVGLRGGDVQAHQQFKDLENLARNQMGLSSPVASLRLGRVDKQGRAHKILGVPLPVALILFHDLWTQRAMTPLGSSRSMSSGAGSATTARARAAHLRDLARWARDELAGDDLAAAMALAECASLSLSAFADPPNPSVGKLWAQATPKLAALASRPPLSATLLPGVAQALDGRFGALTGRAAFVVAHGLMGLPGPDDGQPGLGNGQAWAQALARMAQSTHPDPIWKYSPASGLEGPGEDIAEALLQRPLLPHAPAWEAFLEHMPAPQGTQLLACALARTIVGREVPGTVDKLMTLVSSWAATHPGHAVELPDMVRACASRWAWSGENPDDLAARAREVCLSQRLPAATTATPPRSRM